MTMIIMVIINDQSILALMDMASTHIFSIQRWLKEHGFRWKNTNLYLSKFCQSVLGGSKLSTYNLFTLLISRISQLNHNQIILGLNPTNIINISTTIFITYIEQQILLLRDKWHKHTYMEYGYMNYRVKFIYSSLNINYTNISMFTKYKVNLSSLYNKSEQKLKSTPVVHAMVLKIKYILLKHEYCNKQSNTII